MINPLLQARRLGLAIEAASHNNPQLLSGLAAAAIALIGLGYGALLGAGVPFLFLLVVPLALIGVWLTFSLPEYAALALLGFRWGFIFDAFDQSLRIQSPSLPLAAVLLVVLAFQVARRRVERPRFDPILLLLLIYLLYVAFGVWYATFPQLVTDRVSDFSKDILYTLVVAFWLIRPGVLEGSVWLLVAVGGLLGTLTVFQEVTQTYDNTYLSLARVKIAFIIEGVEDRPRAAGPVGDPNFYGQQLVVLLPLAIWWVLHARNLLARGAAVYSTLAILAGIGLTYSRGALLAVAVMGLVYVLLFKIRVRYLLFLIPLAVLAFAVAPPELKARFGTLNEIFAGSSGGDIEAFEDNSLENRSRHVIIGLNMFLDSPIIGKSADHFKAFYIDYAIQLGLSPDNDANRNAHNYYLEVLVEHGLIGLGLVTAMMVLCYRRFGEARRTFASLGDQRMADLGGFFQIGFIGYAITAIFLHGDFPRFLWLLVGVAVAFASCARDQRADAGAALPAPAPAPHLGPSTA